MDVPKARAAAAFILMYTLIDKKAKRKRRWWMRNLYLNRMLPSVKPMLEDTRSEVVNETIEKFSGMTTTEFEYLKSLVEPKVKKINTKLRDAISVTQRLAITLRFLATGDSYTSLQYLFRVSKQSISSIVPEVCEALCEALKDWVKIPDSEEEWLEMAHDFEKIWNFPHVIGAIGEKHIMLQSPINDEKKKLDILLFALVDAKHCFRYIDVICQNRPSNKDVSENTKLFKKLEEKSIKIPNPSVIQIPYAVEVPYVFLADKDLDQNENIMIPFGVNQKNGSTERIFDYRLSRAHRVVENAFEGLGSVFRVLQKSMLLEPEKATKIILATIHLHNYLRNKTNTRLCSCAFRSLDMEINGQLISETCRSETESISCITEKMVKSAEEIRSHLAYHFVSNGAISCQDK